MAMQTERHANASPDLSIVTVNYDTGELLLRCLRSVHASTREVRFECIVVDNASRERRSLERVREGFPQVRLLENAENLGFAAGCNVGLDVARGRYLLLLNPDATVGTHVLDRMVAFLDSRPQAAVLGSPLVYPDGRDQGVAGRGFPTPLAFLFGRTTLLTRWFPHNRISARFSAKRDASRTEPYEVDWVSGACMMVRKRAIDEVGALDPGFFFMWEDADWCFRMKAVGWKVYCSHEAGVVHVEAGSRDRGYRILWLTTVAFHRGAYRYYRKHISPRGGDPSHLLVICALAVRALLLLLARSIKRLGDQLAGRSPGPGAAGLDDGSLDPRVAE